MGTNFYVKLPEKNKCDHCGRVDAAEEIHIGKFSMGWKFGFNPRFNSFGEWMEFLRGHANKIYDEYGKQMPFDEFLEMVVRAQDGIWIYDERNPNESEKRRITERYESLDPAGYRIINAKEFS